jgi:glycogen debranching enzyme
MEETLYTIETKGLLEPWDTREWLLTDGTGSFAMGTVAGVCTRRYHSMLVCATKPPVGRVNLVPRVGELLLLDGQEQLHELSVCRFAGENGGTIHPKGYRHLREFRLVKGDGGGGGGGGGGESAVWEYGVEGVTIVKTLRLPPGASVAELTYELKLEPGRWAELMLLPMVALRDFHSLRREHRHGFGVAKGRDFVRVDDHAHGGSAVKIEVVPGASTVKAEFEAGSDWWFGHLLNVESERGQDDVEDLFKAGVFRATFSSSGKVTLRISADPSPGAVGAKFAAAPAPAHASVTMRRLYASTSAYLIHRRDPAGNVGTSVVAGFPWFADWGRDTFISLPGLMLETGRLTEAAEVLSTFAGYVSEGMIPNKFDDYDNSPSYNTVDASLWFVHSAHEYAKRAGAGGKALFEGKLLPACREIVRGYREGTRFSIKMDEADGLVSQGDETTQLTWMDAKYEGHAFTPRQGKAVEINALWYHALRLLGEDKLADRVGRSFREQFWISAVRGLYDVVGVWGKDPACRPNQIFAVSLPHSPLDAEQQKSVVELVRRELLTPMGLRTLSPGDVRYRPTYGGPQSQRDAAYHNGTVWAWLIGPFVDAFLRVNHDTRESREEARRLLAPLLRHLEEGGCLGHIAEIFEGQAPHRPVGAPAQAWSLAEVLRAAVRVGA